jgi:hypothetical protein
MIRFESDLFNWLPEINQPQKLGWFGQVVRQYVDKKQNWIDQDDWLRLLVRTSEWGRESNWAGLTARLAYIYQFGPDNLITKKLGTVLINNLDKQGITDNVSPMIITASIMSGREDIFSDWFDKVANFGNKRLIINTGDTLEELLRKQPVSKNKNIQEQAVISQKALFGWFLNWLDRATAEGPRTAKTGDGQTLRDEYTSQLRYHLQHDRNIVPALPEKGSSISKSNTQTLKGSFYGEWLLKSWEVFHLRRDVTQEQCFQVYRNAIALLTVNPEKAMAILTDGRFQIERPGLELMWYLGGRRRFAVQESTKNLDDLFSSLTRLIKGTKDSYIQEDECSGIWKALKRLPLLIPNLPKSLDAGIGLIKLTKIIIPQLRSAWLSGEIEPWWWYGYRHAYQNYIYQCRLGSVDNMNPMNQYLRVAWEVGAGRLPADDPSYQKYLAIRDSSELFKKLDQSMTAEIDNYDRYLRKMFENNKGVFAGNHLTGK